MANLATVSELRGSDRGRDLLGILLEESPLLRFLDQQSAFYEDATDYQFRVVERSNSAKTRTRGGDYTETDEAPDTLLNGSLAFHGDKVHVDHSDQADASRGLRDLARWLDDVMSERGIEFAEDYEVKLMNGDPTSDEIEGLSELLNGADNPPGMSSTLVVDAVDWLSTSPNSFDLSDETNWGTFIENLMVELRRLSANGILLNPEFYGRMYTIAQEKHILGESRDQFGNPIDTFGPYPLVPLVDDAIPNNEPDNDVGNDTTSLYPIRAGEQRVDVVTNSGLEFWDLGDLQEQEANGIKFEIRGQWRIKKSRYIRRVRNFKLY